MSERCTTRACTLLLIFLVSIMSPLASAGSVESEESQSLHSLQFSRIWMISYLQILIRTCCLIVMKRFTAQLA